MQTRPFLVVIAAVSLLPLLACENPSPGEGEGEGEGDSEGAAEGATEGSSEGSAEGEGEGEGEGEQCGAEDPCSASGVATEITFDVSGAFPEIVIGASELVIGTATRATVNTALGAGVADSDNPFRVTYCASRLLVQFVDGDSTFSDSPSASQSDVLARAVTLPNADATTNDGVAIGNPRSELGLIDATYPVGDGDLDLFPADGWSALSDSTEHVTSLAIYRPQNDDRWGIALQLNPGASVGLGTLVVESSTWANVTTVLGDDFDAEGTLTTQGVPVQVRVYVALGIRVASLCGLIPASPCDDTDEITSITVSPPFLGQDGSVGIGSTRADLDVALGTTSHSAANGTYAIYGGTGTGNPPATGALFATDDQCVPHAVGFVLNAPPP